VATNSQFLFSILVFYGILAVALSFYGQSQYDLEESGIQQQINQLEARKAEAGFWETIWINIALFGLGIVNFLMPVWFGIAGLPVWFSIILFAPLTIITIWLILIIAIPAVGGGG